MDAELRPFTPTMVIALCPIAKIFIPSFHRSLMANPDLAKEAAAFNIVINRSSSAFVIPYGKPKVVSDEAIYNFVTGGKEGLQSRETDWSGIVTLDVGLEVMEAMTNILTFMSEDPDKGKQEQKKIQAQFQNDYAQAIKKAKDLSEFRVMRAVKWQHDCLKDQYAKNKENGMGAYTPSSTEFLCSYILADQETKSSEERKKVTESFQRLMEESRIA